jgi:hypothetical protein
MAAWRLGKKPAAREAYLRAVDWMKENSADEPQLRSFRAEAEALIEPR